MKRDFVEFRDVAECYGFPEKAEDVASTWSSEWSVGVIGGTIIPATKALGGWGWSKSRRVVHVAEGEDIVGYGRFIGLLDSGKGERSGDELAGGGIPCRWRTMGMKRTTVIFWRAKLVARLAGVRNWEKLEKD